MQPTTIDLRSSGKTVSALVAEGYSEDSIILHCVTPAKEPYQTTVAQLKLRLWNLTKKMVQKHTSHYYKQYRGDLDDLIQDFYIDFITPKARSGRRPEMLIDKYDSKITSFEYLVKTSVIRKLIDCSRKDRNPMVSIEGLQEEYGDLITEAFHLSLSPDADPTVDARQFSPDEVAYFQSRWSQLSSEVRKAIAREYSKVRGVVASGYRDLFDVLCSAPRVARVRRGVAPSSAPAPAFDATAAFARILALIRI